MEVYDKVVPVTQTTCRWVRRSIAVHVFLDSNTVFGAGLPPKQASLCVPSSFVFIGIFYLFISISQYALKLLSSPTTSTSQ